MSLPEVVLDDRSFQQLVDEVRKRIPLYCPEWTDHNISDPGITLIELFAWMMEQLIYRVNQVPERHYFKFMEMLGYQRQGPSAAQTRVTFWLSKQLVTESDTDGKGVLIKKGTEVSTTQTEGETPIIFTTEDLVEVHAPDFRAIYFERIQDQSKLFSGAELTRLQAGLDTTRNLFSAKPIDNEAVWFGFSGQKHNLSYHVLLLYWEMVRLSGKGIENYQLAPYLWEAFTDKQQWEAIDVERDTTNVMNTSGEFLLHLPKLARQASPQPDLLSEELYWIRVRLRPLTKGELAQGYRQFSDSPKLTQIGPIATVGASIPATHSRVIENELLGESDGSPGQTFRLQASPVLPLEESDRLQVLLEGDEVEYWHPVEHFATAKEKQQCFVLDHCNGQLRLGPAVLQPTGEIRCYGAVPKRGARLVLERYRVGGGAKGNVQRKAINILKTSIPYVQRIENRIPATGGKDVQTLDSAKMDVQYLLRTRNVLITPEDYEGFVTDRFKNEIARVKCIPLRNSVTAQNSVQVLLIPYIPGYNRNSDLQQTISSEELQIRQELLSKIEQTLDPYRLLTTQLAVKPPDYVRVRATVHLRNAAEAQIRAVRWQLYSFLNPLNGGWQKKGWEFGQDVSIADLQKWLERLPGYKLEIVDLELETLNQAGETQQKGIILDLKPSEVVLSADHQVLSV